MKITSVTGVKQIDNLKCFKPISKVFIKTIYPKTGYTNDHDPLIRIRLVDGANGSSKEIVPEMSLEVLSEIASKYEGFQRRAYENSDGALMGYDLSSILLGQQIDDDVVSAIDLSNDKYIDIDLRNLDPVCEYEVWGMESHIITQFVRSYQKFYLSAGELEKSFSTGDHEVLVFPINEIKELQMYAKNSGASPVFRKEELILQEESRNDLTFVRLTDGNNSTYSASCYGYPSVDPISKREDMVRLPIVFGFGSYGIMSVTDFFKFDVRREDGLKTLMFLMIDTIPSVITGQTSIVAGL